MVNRKRTKDFELSPGSKALVEEVKRTLEEIKEENRRAKELFFL